MYPCMCAKCTAIRVFEFHFQFNVLAGGWTKNETASLHEYWFASKPTLLFIKYIFHVFLHLANFMRVVFAHIGSFAISGSRQTINWKKSPYSPKEWKNIYIFLLLLTLVRNFCERNLQKNAIKNIRGSTIRIRKIAVYFTKVYRVLFVPSIAYMCEFANVKPSISLPSDTTTQLYLWKSLHSYACTGICGICVFRCLPQIRKKYILRTYGCYSISTYHWWRVHKYWPVELLSTNTYNFRCRSARPDEFSICENIKTHAHRMNEWRYIYSGLGGLK